MGAHTTNAIDLNQPDTYLPSDPSGIMRLTVNFPNQCREAIAIGEKVKVAKELSQAKNVILCGLGGSAIAGDLVARLTSNTIKVPFFVNRQYDLPSWANQDTLVILSSYSGNTEETLSAFAQARERKAHIACITSGGEVSRIAEAEGLTVAKVPGGQPPRASTGYMIFPLIAILEKAGLIPSYEAQRTETLEIFEAMSKTLAPETAMPGNEAKEIATALEGKFALIYGWDHLAPVAYRWQTQFNENTKALAHGAELPEMNHNEIVAWGHRSKLTKKLAPVLLRTESEPARTKLRLDLTKRVITIHANLRECTARGKSRMAQQMSLLYLGDFVSVYGAFLNHKDPMEINAINFLKNELAK
jgi:glucose/mannose-6-phosphate isomerase